VTKKAVFILLVLLLAGAVGVMAISAQESTQKIDMKLTGTLINIGEGKGLFDVNLRGSPGQAEARGLSFSSTPVGKNDLPDGNICVDIPDSPDGLLISSDAQLVMLFNDGSMLFGNGVDGGYVCFVPHFAHARYEFAGGTGRYEGATGHVQFDIDTHPFGPSGAVIPETGTASGEIVLP
jgi:hypothetical protein